MAMGAVLDPVVHFQHRMERRISLSLESSTACDAKPKAEGVLLSEQTYGPQHRTEGVHTLVLTTGCYRN